MTRKLRRVEVTRGINQDVIFIETWSAQDPHAGQSGTGYVRCFDGADWPIAACYLSRLRSGKKLHPTADCCPPPPKRHRSI